MKIMLWMLFAVAALLLSGCAANAPAPQNSAPNGAGNNLSGAGITATGAATGATSAQTITMTASKFKFTPGTDSPITVKRGVPVKLLITSTDVAHGIAVPDLKINANLPVGEQVEVDFTPNQTGTFPFRCAVFCGEGHRAMTGTIVVAD